MCSASAGLLWSRFAEGRNEHQPILAVALTYPHKHHQADQRSKGALRLKADAEDFDAAGLNGCFLFCRRGWFRAWFLGWGS